MRQEQLTHSVMMLCALLVAAGAGFAWVVEQPSLGSEPISRPADAAAGSGTSPRLPLDVNEGRERYAERCSRCHELDEAWRPLLGATDPEAAHEALLSFLQTHRKSQPDENAAIVDYLQAQLATRIAPPTPAD
jgi:mono/diheme cytochrome c family protein